MRKVVGIIFVILLVGSVILYFAWGRVNKSKESYRFVEVTRGDLESIVSTTGTIEAKGTVEVGTQVSGIIDRIYVDFNDRVKKGQLLAVLDTSLLEAAVINAEADLEMAKAQYKLALEDYKSQKPLYEKGIISKADFLKVEANLKQRAAQLKAAEVALQRAKRNLEYAYIRSPIDGTVIERNVEEGQTVVASLNSPTLFVIAQDLSKVEIHALVDESDIGLIKEGQPVRFTVAAYPDKVFTGRVRQIRLKPEVIQNVVNYTVIVEADNPENLLLPGMTATVDFIVAKRENVLMVPNSALRFKPTPEMIEKIRKRMEKRAKETSSSESSSPSRRHFDPNRFLRLLSRRGTMQVPKNFAVLWYLDEKGELRIVPIRTGLTDGKRTEIVWGRGVKEGMKVISGIIRRGAVTGRRPGFFRRVF